jgi:ligand-binding sensor domain-containing protein
VKQITLDTSGYLYAATSVGLYRIGSSAVLVLPTPTSCVCVDGAGRIYAGTAAGLQVSSDGGSTWTTELAGQTVTSVTTTAPLYSF